MFEVYNSQFSNKTLIEFNWIEVLNWVTNWGEVYNFLFLNCEKVERCKFELRKSGVEALE